MERTFEQIVKELSNSIEDVKRKRLELEETNVKADKMIDEARNMKILAANQLAISETSAVELRKEMNNILDFSAPLDVSGRVRQG